MTAPGTRGSTASTSRPRRRKGGALTRGLVMQGVLFQGGLALVLLLMAFLSRDDPPFFAAYLWSLVIPAGVVWVFLSALRRTQRSTDADAEAREGKRAMARLGVVFTLWVVGLLAIVLL